MKMEERMLSLLRKCSGEKSKELVKTFDEFFVVSDK